MAATAPVATAMPRCPWNRSQIGQPLPATAQTAARSRKPPSPPTARATSTGTSPWANWIGPEIMASGRPVLRNRLLVPGLPEPTSRRSRPPRHRPSSHATGTEPTR